MKMHINLSVLFCGVEFDNLVNLNRPEGFMILERHGVGWLSLLHDLTADEWHIEGFRSRAVASGSVSRSDDGWWINNGARVNEKDVFKAVQRSALNRDAYTVYVNETCRSTITRGWLRGWTWSVKTPFGDEIPAVGWHVHSTSSAAADRAFKAVDDDIAKRLAELEAL